MMVQNKGYISIVKNITLCNSPTNLILKKQNSNQSDVFLETEGCAVRANNFNLILFFGNLSSG